MQIVPQPVFPSMIWSTLFDDRESFNARLLALANEMRRQDPKGVANSNVRGWQSRNVLQSLTQFRQMNTRILQVCERIAESQRFDPDLDLRLQAWINISPPGASNKLHYHANCHFSGVYYISVDTPDCGSIYFRDPRVASRMLSYPTSNPTDFTTSEVRMRPEEGRLYVFPGWLEHGVDENQSNHDRVSLSFNVLAMPKSATDSQWGPASLDTAIAS